MLKYKFVFDLAVRRHSTSSLAVTDQDRSKSGAIATTIQPTPPMKGVTMTAANYRKKCSTTPGPMNGRVMQRITIPLLSDKDRRKRPNSSVGRPAKGSVSTL